MACLPANLPPPSADLKPRILSGLALATVALVVIWLGFPFFDGFILLATVIGALEWRRLCGLTEEWHGWAVVVMVAVSILLAAIIGLGPALMITIGIGGVLLATATVQGRRLAWSGIGIIYIGAPAALAIYLRGGVMNGALLFLWIGAVVVATDVGAFAGGRAIGGPHLAPRVSPAKTWSGAVVGGLAAGSVGVILAWQLRGGIHILDGVLAIVISVAAQIGDLFESAVKRRHKRKDAGSIIPGHGGVLDRVDGLLFALPAYALLSWLGLGLAV